MTDQDYLSLLRQGTEFWNRWRSQNPTAKPDLSQAYLFEANLSGADLRQVNLSRACLIGANLTRANLHRANLQGVYLSGAILTHADLREADCQEANFSGADLRQAQVEATNFTDAQLSGARLEGWSINSTTRFEGIDRPDLVQPAVPKYQRQALSLGATAEPSSATPSRSQYQSGMEGTTTRTLQKPAIAQTFQPQAPASSPITRLQQITPWQVGLLISGVGLAAVGIINLTGAHFRSVQPADSLSAETDLSLPVLPCQETDLLTLPDRPPDHLYRNGTRYYGSFVNGKPADGRGIMLYESGDRYDGEFRNGQRNGCGTFTFANGRRYVGQFQDDQFSGLGSWTLENGDRYIGEFKDNKCDGQGTFQSADGSSKSGIWRNGNLLDSRFSCNRGGSRQPQATVQ